MRRSVSRFPQLVRHEGAVTDLGARRLTAEDLLEHFEVGEVRVLGRRLHRWLMRDGRSFSEGLARDSLSASEDCLKGERGGDGRGDGGGIIGGGCGGGEQGGRKRGRKRGREGPS
jgi:hypothetical protein